MKNKEITLASLLISFIIVTTTLVFNEIWIMQVVLVITLSLFLKSTNIKSYTICFISLSIVVFIFNFHLLPFMLSLYFVPITWNKIPRPLNFFATTAIGIVSYASVFLVSDHIMGTGLVDASSLLFMFVVVGEAIFAAVFCYIGDEWYGKYVK